MSEPDPGFTLPDWNAPLDTAAQISRAPESGTIKGLYFQDVIAVASAHGTVEKARPRYLPFLDYPMREYMQLLVAAANIVYPREPIRNGLRRLGRLAYPTLAETLIGRALFGVAGGDFGIILGLASRAYSISVKPGEVTLAELEGRHALLRLRDLWNFPDTYQVGVFEGGLIATGLRGEVRVRVLSPCDVDFEVTWSG
jgi:uncharacterized protein (TIGR02265 family)